MRIAVVHNGSHNGIINRFGRPCPEKYSLRHVQRAVDVLQASGHTVVCLEADKTLLSELERFMPPDPITHKPTGLVFNMAYGIQGDCRYTHTPAILEMAGVPYTGSNPLGHALALDKVITKVLMIDAGVPTPAYTVIDRAGQSTEGLTYPLVVKPRHESTSYGLHLVRDRRELDAAVESVVKQYEQAALVEDYIDGREVCIGLLGNEPMEFLPPVELDFSNRVLRLMTWDDKYHKRADEPQKICPAPLDASTMSRLNELALAAFHACHLKDYARVDIRMNKSGQPFVLEINSMASLGDGGSFVTAAKAAGYSVAALIDRIVDVTHRRYFGVSAPRNMAGGIRKAEVEATATVASVVSQSELERTLS